VRRLVTVRLHRSGRFRAWLGARFGGDAELGDRLLRRGLHFLGASVLLLFVLPSTTFVVVTVPEVLALGLAVVLGIEFLRLAGLLEMPAMRPYERGRPASYAWYAIALVAAVLLFPPAIATVVVLGTAFLDPLIGELRRSGRWQWLYPTAPILAYFGLAAVGLTLAGWAVGWAVGAAAVAALVAVASERPKMLAVDDDLAMTLVPAAALLALGALGPLQ